MNKLLRTSIRNFLSYDISKCQERFKISNGVKILILSIAVFGAGILLVLPTNAQGNELVVEYLTGAEWKPLEGPIFSETNFSPGDSITRLIRVTNNSGQTQRIATEAINKNDPYHLGSVLNLEIKEAGVRRYNNALSSFFNAGEVFLSNLAHGATTQYDFIVTFHPGVGNPFQGKSLGFYLLVGFQGTEGGILPGAGTGVGGFLPPGLTIHNETIKTVATTSVTITWFTNYLSTSQVIYAREGESRALCLTPTIGCAIGTPPKYGYAHTTPKYNISPRVTFHSVTITGLTPGTTYYYRAVSHASLAISEEDFFTTLEVKEEELILAEETVLFEEGIPVPEEIVGPPEEIKEEVREEIVLPKEEIVTVPPEGPPERRTLEGSLAPALLASLSFSWQSFLGGQLFNNLIFWIIIAVLGILFYGFSLIKKPRMFFRAIGFIGVFSLLIATLLLPLPIINQLRMPLPDFISYPLGILLFIGGILIMFLATKTLSFKTTFGIAESEDLVVSGLYGIVRHPLYLGLIIAYLGWCITFKALPAFLMAPIIFIFLWILTIFEERDLLKTYGENYKQHIRRVPQKIIPKII